MRFIPSKPWGRLALGMGLVVLVAYTGLIHGFLAVTRPVSGQVLIVEGWFYDRPALDEAVAWFTQGRYELVLCVGGTAPGPAGEPIRSYADLAANRLVTLGLDRKILRAVPLTDADQGRTFGSALAAREWLRRERPDVRRVDVFTIGVHARKSHLLFRKALGPEFTVGIIAAKENLSASGHWWASPAGWYIVLRNTAGYFQALAQSPDSSQNP